MSSESNFRRGFGSRAGAECPFALGEVGAGGLDGCFPEGAWAAAAIILAFRLWERLSARRNRFSWRMALFSRPCHFLKSSRVELNKCPFWHERSLPRCRTLAEPLDKALAPRGEMVKSL
ncbi:hypothetical protein MRX96_047003 [Rhipicephalus microplus]